MSDQKDLLRVVISTVGRFWAFDLADQMRQRGVLARLYTAYPRFKINRELQPFAHTFPWLFSSSRLAERVGLRGLASSLNWPTIESFDRWVAKRMKPCDVFVHFSGFGLHAARRAKNFGARIVCDRGSSHILYQDEILEEEHNLCHVAYSPMDRRILEKELREYDQADLITVPSTFAYRSFVEKGVAPEKLCKLILGGADPRLFHLLPKEDRRFRVIFVGSYSIRKGIHYLFEAVRPLVKKGDVEVWLVGKTSPEASELLRRYADIFIDKGYHPHNKLSWFYSQASVLVLPSIEDGFGLVLAQAMACGVPVIATHHTGAEDLLTDGVEGFIVPIRDPGAIREKIRWMLNNPLQRQEMGEAALRRIRNQGGWDTYGEQAMDIYARLVEERDLRKSGRCDNLHQDRSLLRSQP